MNQKHRVIKPFISIESFKVAPGTNKDLTAGVHKSSIPVLPPANVRLNPESILIQRRESVCASNVSIPTPIPNSSKTNANSNIIFTAASGANAVSVGLLSKGQDNAFSGDPNSLQRKISHLESQNEQLRLQLQTEDGIKNYRATINNRATIDKEPIGKPKNLVHASCQTALDGASVDSLQDKLTDAHRRMHALQSARHHEAPNIANPKVNLQSIATNDSSAMQSLREALASMEVQLAELRKRDIEMRQQVQDAERVSHLHMNSKEENRILLQQLNAMQREACYSVAAGHATLRSHAEAVIVVRNAQAEQRTAVQDELSRFGKYLNECLLPQISALMANLESKDSENARLQQISAARDVEVNAAVLRAERLQECFNEEKRSHAELKTAYDELEASILAKKDAATATAHAVATVLANAAKAVPASNTEELRRQLDQHQILIVQLENKHKSASQEREKYFLRTQHLSTQLSNVRKLLDNLCVAHGEVLKTTKHSAHVKDLQRVVATRELALEKDRADSMVSREKDINSVLSFCLNSVETTLLEIQPQVVIRIADSRTRRLQILEQTYRRRNKDIEQRSAETCALGAQALEGFQTKADLKAQEASEVWNSVLEQLQNTLKELQS